MRTLTMIVVLFSVSACSFVTEEHNESYGSGYIDISESEWATKYNAPYPFTVPFGEISCGLHPKFGREVYFAPKGYTDEKYIPTPLNQTASKALVEANMTSDVPYTIKEGAALSTAIKIGLKICDEQQSLEASKTS